MRGQQDDDGERVSLAPLDPLDALRALLAVDPDAEPADDQEHAQDRHDERVLDGVPVLGLDGDEVEGAELLGPQPDDAASGFVDVVATDEGGVPGN